MGITANSNLHKAKKDKENEFYTQLYDIENELKHYKKHFKDKVVFLNCDDPESSNFWKFFSLKIKAYGIKKLISTHYNEGGSTYKLEINANNEINVIKTNLTGDGDFRSDESIAILQETDIVVTNPPFSLFREYMAQLIEYDKKFLIVGPVMAMTYKEIFPLMQKDNIWIGNKRLGKFLLPDGTTKAVGTLWFTNLDLKKRHEKMLLTSKYQKEKYIKYDNYDAIDCVFNRKVQIPKEYTGEMGVPITFMEKINKQQFEIIKFRKGNDNKDLRLAGKDQPLRIIIKNKEVK